MIFVIGNGTSRKNVNLSILKKHGKVIGCNALYRNFTPDLLFTFDSDILHEIISSQYCIDNEVYVLNEISYLPEFAYYDVKNELSNVIENDKNNSVEFISHGFGGKSFISWIPIKNKIKIVPFDNNGRIFNAGFCACRLAHELYKTEEIFLIGFDIYGNTNNIYNYPAIDFTQQIFLFNSLSTLYPNINVRRVINDGPELETISNINYEELCQHLQINQKILITST